MSKKAKIVISILSAIIIVALAVIIPLLVIKSSKVYKLTTPTKPDVFQSENLISINTSKIKNAKTYMFEITIPTQTGKTLTFESESNLLLFDFENQSQSLKTEFAAPGVYSVCVYAIADKEESNSYKSLPTTFERSFKLETPTLFKSGNYLKWDTIENADFYELHISSTSVSEVKIIESNLKQISISDLKAEFDLPLDYYTFSLRACSENQYLISSNYSAQLEFYINE